jgi:hypothetical protein
MRDGLSGALTSPANGSGTVIVVSHDILRVGPEGDRAAG